MKIIKIEVKSCQQCLSSNYTYCVKEGRDIPDITTIPDWCELEDAPEEKS